MTCNDFGQSSIVFGHGLHPPALLLRHSPLKESLASAYPPKPLLFEMGAPASVLASEPSDAITVPWCKVAGCLEGRRARTESYRLASAYPPKPLLFEMGAQCDL